MMIVFFDGQELEASAVDMGTSRKSCLVLLHKKRVPTAAIRGESPVRICHDCHRSFSGKKPTLCKYALANDLWLGRIDPLLWKANLTHEMCLSLARTVATKVVLRSGQNTSQGVQNANQWDHVFQQSGLVGSAIVFHNGDATKAVESLPPRKLNDALAVTFCTDLETDNQEKGREIVRSITHFQLQKDLFLEQATSLRETNPVYKDGVTEINRELLTEWFDQQVPAPILDCVVTVPVGQEGPGKMRQEGPAGATEQRTTSDDDPIIFALESEVSDFNESGNEVCNRVVMLLQKLEELDAAGARSVALEMECAVQEQPTILDEQGRRHIMQLCKEIHESCQKLSARDLKTKLEEELSNAVNGKSRWFLSSSSSATALSRPGASEVGVTTESRPGTSEVGVTTDDVVATSEVGVTTEDGLLTAERDNQGANSEADMTAADIVLPTSEVDLSRPMHLTVARGKKPLSFWDWKIWTMARPRLWRYGDAGNLFERETSLATSEWAACLLLREELEYNIGDEEYQSFVSNRFSSDWVALHMMATVCRLTDQRAASYRFLTNGGMSFAKTLAGLTAEKLAYAARVSKDSGASLQQIGNNTAIPKEVKDTMLAMNGASSAVLGTDGHRQFCRHEGVAYMETFGPPLIFVTPNVADTQHPLLLIVQGQAVDLGRVDADMENTLPKYRDMLRRLAQDPVGQVIQFEFLMRLFLQHVLNVRPETLDCRRNSVRGTCREWCSDGAAAASTGAGMLGPVLAFRGEIEAQGRGSLHPHILVWLVCGHLEVMSQLAEMLRENKTALQQRLKEFMQLAVASFESISHASVQAAPRCLGTTDLDQPVKLKKIPLELCKFDGGSDLDLLRELIDRTPEQDAYLAAASEEDWRRPTMELDLETIANQQSIFATPINQLSVATTPQYRLRPLLCDPSVPELDAQSWREAFQKDLHTLMPSLLRHVCTESCYKYSDSASSTFKICRHGFYHVIHVCDGCRRRRKGKSLRPCLYIGGEEESVYGMEGRLRPIQLSPFECQTSYGGTVSGRHNLDLQDMRRVVPSSLWLGTDDHLPHVGVQDFLGYMAWYEWTGSSYHVRAEPPVEPVSWISRRKELGKSFRTGWYEAYRAKLEATEMNESMSPADDTDKALAQAIRVGVNEAFCDGINTGFYVNNYTTKPGPGLASVMEELQKGIERLENENKDREAARKAEEAAAREAGEHLPARRRKVFAETLRTLTRLTSSYRRCHWKSAAEIIFPLLFQHLTFASHRTWKLYVKKAVFFAVEAWRRQYGDSVLQQVMDKGDANEPLIFSRPGVDDLVLKGWKKIQRIDPESGVVDELFIGPKGQACVDIVSAFDEYQAESDGQRKPQPQQKLSLVQQLLQLQAIEENAVPNDDEDGVVTNLQAPRRWRRD